MAWRVKPEEVLIEVGKLFGSKVGLQKLNYEVRLVKILLSPDSYEIIFLKHRTFR